MPTPEACMRCGRPVPTRLRGTGYCTIRCAREQDRDDRDSAAEEWSNDPPSAVSQRPRTNLEEVNAMKWIRDDVGTWRSTDNRYWIFPEYGSTTRPQGYRLEGPSGKSTHDTVRHAKRHARQ